jgi:hypothetical protein
MSARTILFVAWGDAYVDEVRRCILESRLPDYPIVVVTDATSAAEMLPPKVSVIRRTFASSGKDRKAEVFADLPAGLETVLFLDADTRVIGDISLGFEKAERHGIAMAPAPHYSLADFRSFGAVMAREGVPARGQMIYNSGVIFFAAHEPSVRAVFRLAFELEQKDPTAPYGDQPYVTLAMEIAGFNPYTLSPSFNHRAFGELISGSIRIWHSYGAVPPGAADLEPGYLHRYENGAFTKALKVPL